MNDLPAASTAQRYPLAIIGAGALGLSFAARIAPHLQVAVIARDPERAHQLRAGTLIGQQSRQLDAFGPEDAPAADWVIVLVKAADTAAAAATALRMQPLGIVSLQNGLVDSLLPPSSPQRIVGQGITTEGAWRDARGVHPSGAGETLLPSGFEALATLLRKSGFKVQVDADIGAARLAKLLINAAINPLAALFRVTNGELLSSLHRPLLDRLVLEAWPVLQRAGLKLDRESALLRVHAVATATANNRASMLQDLMAGRNTEIDAITGALLQLAAAEGSTLPTHRAVYTLVKTLEEGSSVSPR